MIKVIILGNDIEEEMNNINIEYNLCEKPKDAFLFQLENSEVDSYIINLPNKTKKDIVSIVEKINYLNPLINIYIYSKNPEKYNSIIDNNISIISHKTDFENLREDAQINSRKFNRVPWPLTASFFLKNDIKTLHHGKIISLSAGGCCIKLDKQILLDIDGYLNATLFFKGCKFYSDTQVKRISKNDDGFIEYIGIKFINVSSQTQQILKDIINEKILSELIQTINTGHETDKELWG
jgi:hypothetical protein